MTVTTFSHNKFAFDPTEHDHLVSAEVMKAKFKLADEVLKHVCVEYEKRCYEEYLIAQFIGSFNG